MQVLAYFQTTFPEVRLLSNSLKAYVRRGLQVDQQTSPPPRAVAPAATAAHPIANTTTVAPRSAASLPVVARPATTTTAAVPSSSTLRIKPEIVTVAPVQPTTQAPANDRTENAPPPRNGNFMTIASSMVKSERVDAAAPPATNVTAIPSSSSTVLVQQVPVDTRNSEHEVPSRALVVETAAISQSEAPEPNLSSSTTVLTLHSDRPTRIASIGPVGPVAKSVQSQNEQQRSLKRNHEMEELLELQELKKQKLVLENFKLARELGFITAAQSLEMARHEVETRE